MSGVVALLLLAATPAFAGDLPAQAEACLQTPAACPLDVDTPLGAALALPPGDPRGYPAFGIRCQEHEDCAPLAAFAAARCALQEAEGCRTLASLHDAGELGGYRPVVASALTARACAAGHAESCAWVGLPPVGSFGAALDAEPPPLDLPSPGPISLLLSACDEGAGDACLALIRQMDADGPRSDARAVLVGLLDAEAERGRAAAADLLATLRWLDEPLPPHLWAIAGPLQGACARDLDRACALGAAVLHLERASGRAPPQPALLDDTVAEPTPDPAPEPERPRNPRWVETTLPGGVGASFTTATPLLRIGLGVRAGWGAFLISGQVAGAFDAARPPPEALYRRFIGSFGAGVAIPIGPEGRLILEGGIALGTRTTTGAASFSFGPRELVEISWLMKGDRGPTLGFRASSQQAFDVAGPPDILGAVEAVFGLRFPD